MKRKFFLLYIKPKLQVKILLLLFGIILLMQSCENKAEKKSERINHGSTITKLMDKAAVFYDKSEFDISYIYYHKAYRLCDPKIDYENYVSSLSSMADIQATFGDYITSEALLTKTLPYLKKVKNPRIARNVYSYIAVNYYNTYDYDKSLIYHQKALKFPATPFKKAIIVGDVALLYIQQKKYNEAAILLELLTVKKVPYKREPEVAEKLHAYNLNQLAYSYFNLGNSKCLALYLTALKINIKTKSHFGLVQNYKYLSIFYEKTNPKLAHDYAKKSYEHACIINSATNKANSLAQLIKTSEGNELKKYSLKYIKIIDSITIGRRKSKNQFAQIKYDSKRDKAENLQLRSLQTENNLQLEKQKNQILILSLLIICSLGGITFLYFNLKSKGRNQKKEAIYKSETRISKKLQDELADDVYQTLAFAGNYDLELTKNKNQLLNNLDRIYSQTRNISKENSNIITNENYAIALKEMISEYKSSKQNILTIGFDNIIWNKMEKNKKIIVYRVLQEILVNIKKHSDASLIMIAFKIIGKKITIDCMDNGHGLQNNNLIFKKDLQNVENRINTINGTIIFDINSQNGFKLSFTFSQ